MSAPLQARQLIFANVEADQSPTRQRGFQVWQASPELSSDDRHTIAKRIDDFVIPTGVPSDQPDLKRHVFVHLPKIGYLFASAVPLQQRDKFGRGGRFIAHAIIIGDEDFAGLGHHPFAIFDGSFPFRTKDPKDDGEEWKALAGKLPLAEVPVIAQPEVGEAALPNLADLAAFLESNGDVKTLAVPAPDTAMMPMLRTLFGRLPPAIRRNVSFDTLSTGASLSQFPVRIVGAYSPEVLKRWKFAKYVQLVNGECVPKLPPSSGLMYDLLALPAWSTLTPEDQAVAMETSQALFAGTLPAVIPEFIVPLLEASPATPNLLSGLWNQKLESVPASLRGLPEVGQALAAHSEGTVVEQIGKLGGELPDSLVSEALFQRWGRTRAQQPTDEQLQDLRAWMERVGSRRLSRLGLIAARWDGAFPDDYNLLLEGLDESGDKTKQWLRGWLPTTLPPLFADGVGSLDAVRNHFDTRKTVDAETRWNLQLYELMLRESHPNEARELWYLHHYHTGPIPFQDVFEDGSWEAVAPEQLVVDVLRQLTVRKSIGWTDNGIRKYAVGMYLRADGETRSLLQCMTTRTGRRLHAAFVRELLGTKATYENRHRQSSANSPDTPREDITAMVSALRVARADQWRDEIRRSSERLQTVDDASFKQIMNQLLFMSVADPMVDAFANDIYFVGYQLHAKTIGELFPRLFELVVGTIADKCDERDVVFTSEDRPIANRVWFLFARLSNLDATLDLKI